MMAMDRFGQLPETSNPRPVLFRIWQRQPHLFARFSLWLSEISGEKPLQTWIAGHHITDEEEKFGVSHGLRLCKFGKSISPPSASLVFAPILHSRCTEMPRTISSAVHRV